MGLKVFPNKAGPLKDGTISGSVKEIAYHTKENSKIPNCMFTLIEETPKDIL